MNEIDKNETITIEALKFMTGLPKNVTLEIITEPLKYEKAYMNPDELTSKAFILRPEITQIKEGLKARQALIDVEKSNLYPQIFFLVKGSLARATNRNRIHNPYIYDPINDSMLAAVIGMKLNIDFGITKGKIREAEIEYQKILEKKNLAEKGIPVQIMKAYFELQEAAKTARDMEEAYNNVKKWLVTADANIDMGIGETKDLAEALLVYTTTIFTTSNAFATVSPKEQIKKIVDKVISILKDPKYDKAQQRRNALRAEIGKVFDFEEMSKRSVGVYWRERTPKERKEFADLYKDLLERSYSGKIESYVDEEIIYTEEK